MSGRWDSKESKIKFWVKAYLMGCFTLFGSIKATKIVCYFFTGFTFVAVFDLVLHPNIENVKLVLIGTIFAGLYGYTYKLNKEQRYMR